LQGKEVCSILKRDTATWSGLIYAANGTESKEGLCNFSPAKMWVSLRRIRWVSLIGLCTYDEEPRKDQLIPFKGGKEK